MSLEDEVKEVLEQNKTRPLDAYEQARKLLIGACQSGARCDPLGTEDQSKEGRQAFHAAHDWFKHHGYHPASEKLLIEWWNLLGKRQYESKKRIYRADTAFLLSNLYESMSDKGMALRWAMLMQADDILGEHSEGGGPGSVGGEPRENPGHKRRGQHRHAHRLAYVICARRIGAAREHISLRCSAGPGTGILEGRW